uniref:zinc finger and SCAN domain-containing protein 2-like isoform X2 n=1 Tax=Doryrhamphus excisus TaxID=161450 RepID=UPI0025AE8DB4|nr:zinc finger and SCAN domain-containing protein 2-like isoform X2 [Doryrhamphus excisus]
MSSEGLGGTRFWGEEEAVFLLRQLKELNIFKWVNGRKIRNAEVFKKVAKKMEEAGFIRTFEQIKGKWKSMKRIYFVTKRKIKINGHNSVPCPYFDLLDDLLGGRALSQTCGLDVGFGASVSESVPKDQREPTDDPEKHPDEEDAVEMEETAETEERETDSPPVLKTKTRPGERQRPRGRRSDVRRFTSSMERLQTALVYQLRQSQEMQERLVNSVLQSNESMVSALLKGIQSLRPRPPDQRGEKEADGDHRGGSQADNLLAPLSDSDDTTSYSPEAEDQDSTQKPLSSNTDHEDDLRTHTDNKDSECSKKKTGKKPLTCSVCDKSFSCMSHLSRHVATHTGEKRFICSVCGKGFFERCDLAQHMRTHTGEKPFSCSVCGNTFSQRSTLTAHMRTHTGERPFSCSICGARFFRQSEVVSHKRTHTGEKPFSCSVCGKRFAQRGQMTVHAKVHTGEKAFSCSICGASFVQKWHVVSHMRTHAENKNS